MRKGLQRAQTSADETRPDAAPVCARTVRTRGEHADERCRLKDPRLLRRWHATLDAITAQAMMGTVTPRAKWSLDTQVIFVVKTQQDAMDDDDGNDWIRLLERAELEHAGGEAIAAATLTVQRPDTDDAYGTDPSDADDSGGRATTTPDDNGSADDTRTRDEDARTDDHRSRSTGHSWRL